MENSDDIDLCIKDLFLVEATDLLDQTESFMLTLEKSPADKNAFDGLFRVVHNLKGSGKAVGFGDISNFSHHVENVLVAIRDGKLPMTANVVGLILRCCDFLRNTVSTLKSNSQAVINYDGLLKELENALEGKPLAIAPEPFQEMAQITLAQVNQNKVISASEEFVRVSLQKIEDLLNNFGEAVILQATLDHIKFDLGNNADLALKTINQLSKLTYDLQQTTIALRMVALKPVFSKMERTARDTAVAVGKKIEFLTLGQENEIDKTIAEAISDPLTHMIRNAVDHGLETEQERNLAGKNPVGTIQLNAYRRGGFFYITIQDDGRGMDRDRIFQKAVKSGLVRSDANMTDSQVYDLIYANGFSTKDAATDISGRGVGMNVVKESILALKGTVTIDSTLGKGTLFTIRLPLTLAIFNGMVVRVGDAHYILPNSEVDRVMKLSDDDSESDSLQGGREVIPGQEKVIDVDNHVLPLIDLRHRLKTSANSQNLGNLNDKPNAKSRTLVITQGSAGSHALIVDEVVSQQRIVHKALGPGVNQLRGAAGATILGDGSAALILDLPALLGESRRAG